MILVTDRHSKPTQTHHTITKDKVSYKILIRYKSKVYQAQNICLQICQHPVPRTKKAVFRDAFPPC